MAALKPKFLRIFQPKKEPHHLAVPSRRSGFCSGDNFSATVGYIYLNSFDHQKIQGHSAFSNIDLSKQEVLEYKKNRDQTYSSHNNSVAKIATTTIIATPLANMRLINQPVSSRKNPAKDLKPEELSQAAKNFFEIKTLLILAETAVSP
ncbi:hypothetical protein E0H88_07780 [Acinetobacter sp. ANC 4216]|uniref:hypothetical protein n=1 Tax=Acinetobacter sp. ANC 4216 TaxID=2529840 RepID=UPI0010404BEE|nr:hypothetical protein [Acinetobacter sp. ANC 4216]TCB70453.1 hypothetical protein E0H88_07780 [Acinetobacter sp. ANC 4216]